jgi:peptide/nickel transport system permease protein
VQVRPARARSLTLRIARRLASALLTLAGAVALLFLLLGSGALGDPARAEAGPRAGAAQLAATRARLGLLRDFRPEALTLTLEGHGPARIEIACDDGVVTVRNDDGVVLAALTASEHTLASLGAAIATAVETRWTGATLRASAGEADATRSAAGLARALDGAALSLEPRRSAALAWGEPVSAPARLARRFGELARLEFGTDRHGRAVGPELGKRALRSLGYALPAFAITTVLALALALACARRRGLLDRALMAACALMMSVSAVMLVLILRRVLTGDLGPFPLRPWSPPYAPLLALPAVTWILIALWPELRLYRTLAVEESSRPWLLAARARGLSERRLWWGHLLPNLASPVLAHAALTLPFLLMGSLLLERAYDVPGLGEYLVDALAAHDARALEAATLLAAAAFVLTQAVADLCAARLDPRARAAQEATA